MDIGECLTKWQDKTYLINHDDCKDVLVGVHVCQRSDGLMDFINKNYEFDTMSLSELIKRCDIIEKENNLNNLTSNSNQHCHYYLRTIGKNARKVNYYMFEIIEELILKNDK